MVRIGHHEDESGLIRWQRLTTRALDCLSLKSSAPRNVGSFYSYSQIETTQMTEEHQHTSHLISQLKYHPARITTFVLIKRRTLHLLVPLSTQLHLLNLFGGNATPCESLHAVISCGVEPWFDAFVGPRAGAGKDTGGGCGGGEAKLRIPMTRKSLQSSSRNRCTCIRMWRFRRRIWLFVLSFDGLLSEWVLLPVAMTSLI